MEETLRNSKARAPVSFHEVVEKPCWRGAYGWRGSQHEADALQRTSARKPSAARTAIGQAARGNRGRDAGLASLPEPSARRDPGPGPCGDAIARQDRKPARSISSSSWSSAAAQRHHRRRRVHCAGAVAPCSNKAMHAAPSGDTAKERRDTPRSMLSGAKG